MGSHCRLLEPLTAWLMKSSSSWWGRASSWSPSWPWWACSSCSCSSGLTPEQGTGARPEAGLGEEARGPVPRLWCTLTPGRGGAGLPGISADLEIQINFQILNYIYLGWLDVY